MAGPKHTGCIPKLEKFPQLGLKLIELVSGGCTQAYAAELCQIPPQSISDWIARGKQPGAKKVYRDFSEAMQKARVDFIQANLDGIKRHAQRQWQAHAWLLERCAPKQFASAEVQLRQKVEEIAEQFLALKAEAEGRGIGKRIQPNGE